MNGDFGQPSDCIPQRRLVKLLKEVRAENQRQDSRVDATKHRSLFFVGEGDILMTGQEFGGLLATSVLFPARIGRHGDLVPGLVHCLFLYLASL